jgi:hypothetical protein
VFPGRGKSRALVSDCGEAHAAASRTPIPRNRPRHTT